MENAREKLNRFLKSDSPQAAAKNIPTGAVTFLLAFPAVIFIAAMALELFKSLFFRNAYRTDIIWINCDAAIAGLLAVTLYLIKLHYNGGRAASVFKNPTVIFFSVMVALMILSALRNGFLDEALFGDLYRRETIGDFIIYPTIYYFVASLIGSETAKRRLINAIIVISCLIAAAAYAHVLAAQHGFTLLSDFTAPLVSSGVVGIYHNINHYAYSLVIAITLSSAMFILTENTLLRICYLAGFALLNAVLILNNTFGAYLAVFVTLLALIVLFAIRERRLNPCTFILLGVFAAVSLGVNFNIIQANVSVFFTDIGRVIGNLQGYIPAPEADGAGSTRWRLWKSTLSMISERPFLGYGVEGIGERLRAEAGSDRPHNEFLQYAAFFGIPALICYVGAVTSVFVKFLQRLRETPPCAIAALTAAFGYLVSSFFGNTMYYTAPLFFLVLGMADTRPSDIKSTAK